MAEENTVKEMPIPTYAVGTSILLIDPDKTSLLHTASLLEESSYRVTCIEVPDLALSIVKEGNKKYDLIIAAANMQGVDCLTFLQTIKAFSDTPIVLISFVADVDLIRKALRQGISHFLTKPVKREDARGIWQFVIRKPKKPTKSKKTVTDGKNKQKKVKVTTAAAAGKKPVVSQSQKRKRTNEGKKIYHQSFGYKKTGSTKYMVKWNPNQHEKFMKVLDGGEPSDTPQQGQAITTLDSMMMQPVPLPQCSTQQISGSPNPGMGVGLGMGSVNNIGFNQMNHLQPDPTPEPPSLDERIEKIRREYWSKEEAKNQAMDVSNEVVVPEQNLLVPEQNLVFPEQNPLVPEQNLVFPEQNLLGPEQNLLGPEQNLLIPEQNLVFPEQNLLVPEQNLVFPEQNLLVPEQNLVFPEQNLLVPEQNLVFPEQNLLVPEQNLVFPEQNLIVPEQNLVAPEQNLPMIPAYEFQNWDENQANDFGDSFFPELGDFNFNFDNNDIFLDDIFAELPKILE